MAHDDLEHRLTPSFADKAREEESKLEEKAKEEEKKQQDAGKGAAKPASDWKMSTMIWDGIKYAPLAGLAYLIGGGASLLTPIGLGVGKFITNWKKKTKTTWADMRKTIAVGNFGGAFAYWAYALPDFIIGSPVSLLGKIAKTVLFNPFCIFPWLVWYRKTDYIVNKHGGWNYMKGFFNGKMIPYAKEAYHNDLKKKLLPSSLEIFLTISPIHFYSMNYVKDPTYRVGIGTINDVILSLIVGEEGLFRTISKKLGFGKKKEEEKQPGPMPGHYMPNFEQYARAHQARNKKRPVPEEEYRMAA